MNDSGDIASLFFHGYPTSSRTILLILTFLGQVTSLLVLVLALLYVSFSLTDRLLSEPSSPLLRWCTAGLLSLWIRLVSGLLLLSFGVFRVEYGLALAVGVALLTRLFARPFSTLMATLQDDVSLGVKRLRDVKWSQNLWPLLLGLVAFFLIVRAALLPPLAWDTLTYHGLKAGLFAQTGSIQLFAMPSAWGWHRLFPPGGEVLEAWAMLPFHSDLLFSTVDLEHTALLLLLLLALGQRHLKLNFLSNLQWIAFCLSMPALWKTWGGGYVDILTHVSVLAAALFTLEFAHSSRPLYRYNMLLLSWFSFGVAVSTKVTSLAGIGLLLLFQLWVAWREGLVGGALKRSWIGLFAVGFATVPWMLWNVQQTGLPLSPYPIKVAGVALGKAPPSLQELSLLPFKDLAYTLSGELDALYRMFCSVSTATGKMLWVSVNPVLGGATMLMMLLVPFGLWSLWRFSPRTCAVFALSILGMMLSFYHPGFSIIRIGWADVNGRFLLSAVYLSGLSVMLLSQRGPVWRALFFWVLGLFSLWNVWDFVLYLAPHEWLPTALACLFVGGAVAAYARTPKHSWTRSVVALLLVFLGTYGLFLYKDKSRIQAYQSSQTMHSIPRYWVPCLKKLDSLSSQHIAVVAGNSRKHDNWLTYPWLGKRLQHKLSYVAPFRDGVVRDYQRFFYRRYSRALSRERWLKRLRERKIDVVVAMAPNSLELEWLFRGTKHFEKMAGTYRRWGCFRVKPKDTAAVPGKK